MSLADLSLNTIVGQATTILSTKSLSCKMVFALYPILSKMNGIEERLLRIMCNSNHLVNTLHIYAHFVFPSTTNPEKYSFTCTKLNSLNRSISYCGYLKSGTKSEILLKIENGLPDLEEILEFYTDVRALFGIESEVQPIGLKCVIVFKRSSQEQPRLCEKVFFKPLRSSSGLSMDDVAKYIKCCSEFFKHELGNDYQKENYHAFSIKSYNPEILNWQSCPCQSFICSGGLDNEFSNFLRPCTLLYCDTHPAFTDWK